MGLCRKSVLSGALGGVIATLIVWSSFQIIDSFDLLKAPLNERQPLSSELRTLFELKGQNVNARQLSKELKQQWERAVFVHTQVMRDADIALYKEIDKIARLHVLEKELALRAATEQKSLHDVELELLPQENATIDDARSLYEASDPSAPREGFAPVKNQLIAYLNGVRRREALEVWTQSLAQQGLWKLKVERPNGLPDLSSLHFLGLPAEGKEKPNTLVFVDYLCAKCVPLLVDFAKQVEEKRGTLRVVYVPFPYTRPELSMALARGALCAHQQDAFSSFHLAALTKGDLLAKVSVFELARQANLSMGTFKTCYRSGQGLAAVLERAQTLARQFGLMQTPAVVYEDKMFEGEKISKEFVAFLASKSPSDERISQRESGRDHQRYR